MKIWFISAYDAPKGNSSRTYDYAKLLVDHGHEVTFFTSGFDHFLKKERLNKNETYREESISGIKVVWLKTTPYNGSISRFINMLSNAYRSYTIGKLVNFDQPDVIVGPSVPLFTGLAAFLLSKKKECAFCFEVRDIWPQVLIDLNVLSKYSPITLLLKKIESLLYHKANQIISALPYAYKHIETFGLYTDKISYIPNGTKLARFAIASIYDGGLPSILRVIYAGGFSKSNDVESIIKSIKHLQEKGLEENFSFTFVGGGSEEKKLKELCTALQLKTVKFLGFVPKDEVPLVLAQGDVLIASAKNLPVYRFGINSNKVYDYMSSARPIIISIDSANNPIKDANAGYTVPPESPEIMADALIKLLRLSPKDRKIMGERGLAYAKEHFDIGKLVLKLESTFETAIEIHKQRN